MVEKGEGHWGDETEIKALSVALKLNIEVIRAEGPDRIYRADGRVGLKP